jgi:hypothetical protein
MSVKTTPSKTLIKKSQYTRISISTNLAIAIANVQQEYPLYSTNDAILLLINEGYAKWMNKNKNQNIKNRFSKFKNVNFSEELGENDKFTSNKEMYKEYYKTKYGE